MNQQQPGATVTAEARALDIEICRQIFGHDIKPEWESWLPNIPPYSTNIGTAWAVVKRLREIGLGLVIATEGDGWEVEILSTEALYGQGYTGCYVTAPTVPEAICRAALLSCSAAAEHQQAGDESR